MKEYSVRLTKHDINFIQVLLLCAERQDNDERDLVKTVATELSHKLRQAQLSSDRRTKSVEYV